MTLTFPALVTRYKKQLIITACIAGFALLVVGFYIVFSSLMHDGKSNHTMKQESKSTSNSQQTGSGGTGLQGSVSQLIGSVLSTRNLTGLTLRINQIDTCDLPNAKAYVAVTGIDGRVISDLRKSDVTITVDGQKVTEFSFRAVGTQQRPLASTLVLDKSGSMAGAPMNDAKAAANTYIDMSLGSDTFALVAFDSAVNVLQTRTGDRNAVKNALGGIAAKGNTALFDALSAAIDTTTGCSRKAIVLLSDGDDTASKQIDMEQAVNKANLAGLPVFAVGLKGEDFNAATLQTMADRTGGQYFEAASSADLTGLYGKISDQLKGQYAIGLELNISKTNRRHLLKITSNVGGSPTSSERYFVY